MSFGGNEIDLYMDMFKDTILLETQQMGSVLSQTVEIEEMSGNKTFFNKRGKVGVTQKSSRGELIDLSDPTYERRQVQEIFFQYSELVDVEDLIKSVKNPSSEIIMSAVAAHGRQRDETITNALLGNAVVTTNNSTSNEALPTTQKVAVNDHTYDATTGDVALTTSKLKKGLEILKENHAVMPLEDVFVVSPTSQLMNLTTFDQVVNADYRGKKPLEGPGIDTSLSGYLNLTFISYDPTTALVDSNNDAQVIMYPRSAVKMGIFKSLTTSIDADYNRKGKPDILSIWEAHGATRMYEEKVVEIACDPIA